MQGYRFEGLETDTCMHPNEMMQAEVQDFDAPIAFPGATRGLRVWREVRGPPRNPNDPETEAQVLRQLFVARVSEEFLPEVQQQWTRDPMILAPVSEQEMDGEQPPRGALLFTRNGTYWNGTYWKEATPQNIFENINNQRPLRNAQRILDMEEEGDQIRANQNEDVSTIGTFPLPALGGTTSLSNASLLVLDDVNRTLTEAEMMNLIRECHNVHDFVAVYCSVHYQRCLSRIRASLLQSGMNKVDWAEHWANQLLNGDHDAEALNRDRRICLKLLYAMCDCWGGPENELPTMRSVEEEHFVTEFRPERVVGILHVCLVMDRANAWYNLMDHSAQGQRGLHWYSSYHQDWCAYNGHGRVQSHTMNKRLMWLFSIEGLNLGNDEFLASLLEPARTPLAAD